MKNNKKKKTTQKQPLRSCNNKYPDHILIDFFFLILYKPYAQCLFFNIINTYSQTENRKIIVFVPI